MAVVLCVAFTSCSSDDESKDSNPLVGTWQFLGYEYSDGTVYNNHNHYIHFYVDGKVALYTNDGVETGNYKYDEKTKILTCVWIDDDDIEEEERQLIFINSTEMKWKTTDGHNDISVYKKVNDSLLDNFK